MLNESPPVIFTPSLDQKEISGGPSRVLPTRVKVGEVPTNEDDVISREIPVILIIALPVIKYQLIASYSRYVCTNHFPEVATYIRT